MDKILKIRRLNRFYDLVLKYDIYLNNNKIKISNSQELELKLEEGKNLLFVKFWHIKSNTLILEGNKNHSVEIKNYVTNKQFYIYICLILISVYFSFFHFIEEYFFFNFLIKFIGFYIFSIPIISLTFNSKRNLLIEELDG
ncbi:MAG: hypothetical protein JXQ93_05155 [Flavobacteriaceae bacterium]